ncbi:glucosaminidase domain-containing protein [Motiliproteus sp.]|uniref:glucosaminidase domain-containing protein n=1 Tax=Motiliproteus sp. TaxID=1898955 RepID=UPI003BABB76E
MNRFPLPAVALLLTALYGCQPSDPGRSATETAASKQPPSAQAETATTPAKPLQRSENPPSLNPPTSGPALPDFAAINDVKQKKQQFFAFLEPMIAQENAHTQALRQHVKQLLQLLEQQPQLHPDDQQWLARAGKAFRIDAESEADQLRQLLAKVDQIPAALVKAQAANESAWGTSRFARQANNLFGQWCFTPGCGIAPLQRGPDQAHEVEAFKSVAAGLRSYFTNINGNKSYSDLRQIRRCLRNQQQPISGRALAAGLTHYSARGGHYVDELQSMIRINKLEPWADSWWGDSQPGHPCYKLVQVESDQPDPILVASAAADEEAPATPAVPQDTDDSAQAQKATYAEAPAPTETAPQEPSDKVEPIATVSEQPSTPAPQVEQLNRADPAEALASSTATNDQ